MLDVAATPILTTYPAFGGPRAFRLEPRQGLFQHAPSVTSRALGVPSYPASFRVKQHRIERQRFELQRPRVATLWVAKTPIVVQWPAEFRPPLFNFGRWRMHLEPAPAATIETGPKLTGGFPAFFRRWDFRIRRKTALQRPRNATFAVAPSVAVFPYPAFGRPTQAYRFEYRFRHQIVPALAFTAVRTTADPGSVLATFVVGTEPAGALVLTESLQRGVCYEYRGLVVSSDHTVWLDRE